MKRKENVSLKERAKRFYEKHKVGCKVAAGTIGVFVTGAIGYILGKAAGEEGIALTFLDSVSDALEHHEDDSIRIWDLSDEDGEYIGHAVISSDRVGEKVINFDCEEDGLGFVYENIGD